MESKFRLQIEQDANSQLDHTDVVLVKGKDGVITRQSIEDPGYDPKNKNIVGAIVNWSGLDGGGNGEIGKRGIAGDIGLAHELLGHGLQAMIGELTLKTLAYSDGQGYFPKIENDARYVMNRYAVATNRSDMQTTVVPRHIEIDGQNKYIRYRINPVQVFKFINNKKY